MAKKQPQPLAGDLKSLLDALTDPLWIVDREGQTLWANASANGRPPDGRRVPVTWRGLEATLIQAPAQEGRRRLEELEEREAHALARMRRAEEREQWAEERVARAEERRAWVEDQLARKPEAPALNAGRLQRAEEQARRLGQQLDETRERLKQVQGQVHDQETLARLAYFDERTQLPNRNHARRHLEKLLKGRTPVVVLSLDLDRFQRVRDRYGPSTGHELVKLLTRRLSELVKDEDLLACSGLDCYLVIMPRPEATEVGLRQIAGIAAERVLAEVARPFTVHGQRVEVRGSLGISHCPGDAANAEELLANAEAARLSVKEEGGGAFRFYDGEVRRRQERRSVTEGQLRQAVSAREFSVYYQPIVDLKTARTAGAEALLRWHHRLEGQLLPDQFLPTADALGLTIPIGHLVVEDLIARLRQFPLPKSFFYALNLSHRQFLDASLAERLRPIPAERLVLEMGAERDEDVDRVLHALKPGTRVALDQLGAHPFTFERLGSVQMVKLDRMLLWGVPEDRRATTVYLAALRMVQSLGLVPVAVGIENRVQAQFLRKHGCALGQGNFLSPPVEPEGLAPFLRDKHYFRL